jgi:acetyl esterase/lipase
MKWRLLFLLLMWRGAIFCQQPDHPRDTSYSIQSAYQRIKKDFPFVEPALPKKDKRIRVKTDLTYLKIQDRSLLLDVFYPKRIKKNGYPGILLIFGGGWTSGSKQDMIPMAQQFAKNGFVAVTVEYRLSPEARYPAGVNDLKTAVRWMRKHAKEFGMDTSKIAAYGCSAGAQLASLLGATNGLALFDGHNVLLEHSADVKAVLNIDGIVSFIHPEAEPEWTGKSANLWLGSFKENYTKWKEASPLEYAGATTPPFLVVNSSVPRFHAGRDDLIKILNENYIHNEVYTLPDSPHSFWLLHPWFNPTRDLAVKFLKRVFK